MISAANRETERFDSPQEPHQPQIFGGQVVNERLGWMEVDVRNRIELGDEAECLSPGGQYKFKINAMETLAGESISVAHGGNGTVWVRAEGPVEPYALLSLLKNTS